MRFQNNQKINMEWSAEEQAILEECLVKFAYDSNIVRYAKIAVQLNNKTVRDVALRCRWMAVSFTLDKLIDPASTTSSNLMVQPGFSPYAQGTATNSNGNSASLNATVQLLQHNTQVFDQISANLSSNQIQDNIVLLCQARDNLFRILSNLNEQQNFVARMPPLPVEVNEELANSILPPSTRLRK
nr:M-phase inducer phosphatase-like isoform X1 [Ipomoea batatas]